MLRRQLSDLPAPFSVPQPPRLDPPGLRIPHPRFEEREGAGPLRHVLVPHNDDDVADLQRASEREEREEPLLLLDNPPELLGPRRVQPRQDAQQLAVVRVLVRVLGIREPVWGPDLDYVSDPKLCATAVRHGAIKSQDIPPCATGTAHAGAASRTSGCASRSS